jgi:hypothetical protein
VLVGCEVDGLALAERLRRSWRATLPAQGAVLPGMTVSVGLAPLGLAAWRRPWARPTRPCTRPRRGRNRGLAELRGCGGGAAPGTGVRPVSVTTMLPRVALE